MAKSLKKKVVKQATKKAAKKAPPQQNLWVIGGVGRFPSA